MTRYQRLFKGLRVLVRYRTVLAWSISICIASAIGVIRFERVNLAGILLVYSVLILGACLIQGLMAHAVNDLMDDKSGTDAGSPAILSGGSRVLQLGLLSRRELSWVVFGSVLLAALAAIPLGVWSGKWLALLGVGVWSAGAYSWRPIRLSYYPLAGEWLCAFPALVCTGLAGPWLLLNEIPSWAVTLTVIHALLSLAWLMIHHVPDVKADLSAIPRKWTTVAWMTQMFGQRSAKLPSYLYLTLAAAFVMTRVYPISPMAFTGASLCLLGIGAFTFAAQVDQPVQCASCEQGMIILTTFQTIWLACFL